MLPTDYGCDIATIQSCQRPLWLFKVLCFLVGKPVLCELNIGPDFRALIKHSSNDWAGAGSRTMRLRRLKKNHHDGQSVLSVSILWRSHGWMMEMLGIRGEVAFCVGNGQVWQKNAWRLSMQLPQQMCFWIPSPPEEKRELSYSNHFSLKWIFMSFKDKFAGFDAKARYLKQEILILGYFYTV